MPGRPAGEDIRPAAVGPIRGGRRWPWVFLACGGAMGAAGVAIGAAAAHINGSDLARTASEFILVHAAAVVGATGAASALPRVPTLFVTALVLLVAGTVIFGGDLALAGLWDLRPVPLAAPTGGLLMIAGWLVLAVAALSAAAGGG